MKKAVDRLMYLSFIKYHLDVLNLVLIGYSLIYYNYCNKTLKIMQRCGFSDAECKIILAQIERRAKYRKEFLKLRTDPCMHSKEAGYVFDPALQRWLSMKTCQFDHFKATPKTAMFGFLTIVVPMLVYGYAVWKQRTKFLDDCASGRLRYRDRLHKLS